MGGVMGLRKHFRIEPTQYDGSDMRAGRGMSMGFSNLVGKGVIHRVVPKGNLSSTKAEGRWEETGELSSELALRCGRG